MAFSGKYRVIGFFADQKIGNLQVIAGFPVVKIENIIDFARSSDSNHIVVSREQIMQPETVKVLSRIVQMGFSVSYAPSMDRAFEYEVQLKSVSPEAVLDRPPLTKFDPVLTGELTGKEVLVTGAGGSIGSELCKQLLGYDPDKLILIDSSEFALYLLEQELEIQKDSQKSTEVIYILSSVTNRNMLRHLFRKYDVCFVYHAAAYKHVPIIENNAAAGIYNNVLVPLFLLMKLHTR